MGLNGQGAGQHQAKHGVLQRFFHQHGELFQKIDISPTLGAT
jgi:hypothetical protein